MEYYHQQKCSFINPVITMGTFDGIHRGHQKLLAELRKRADARNGKAVVVTYYHHPLETIHRKTFPYLLTERNKKEELLKKSAEILSITPEQLPFTVKRFFEEWKKLRKENEALKREIAKLWTLIAMFRQQQYHE